MRGALLLLALCPFSLPALAQQAGSVVLQAGWIHGQTLDSSKPLHTDLKPGLGALIGIPDSFDSPGTAASINDADTLLLASTYFATDHWAVKIEGGIPPTFDLHGEGVVQPNRNIDALRVDLGAHNPIASSRQWSPVLLLQYHFGRAEARWRPYLGLGVTYTWFTNVELGKGFYDDLNNTFGRALAVANGKPPGDTYVEADSSPGWGPIVNAGLSYALSRQWGLSASASYVAFKTESTIDIYAGDGTRLSHSTTQIDVDPLVMALMLTYVW
ncbi:OmpW/AlkL family protein [Solimonas variicoloris]|uniref:OmpW/AlkL family protein n=1 Tax=Solimonas variicoloris TaxID=254408 RepID=UPI000475C940|nr:OmpW family outer membrane protein [Solimonas variicoloris]